MMASLIPWSEFEAEYAINFSALHYQGMILICIQKFSPINQKFQMRANLIIIPQLWNANFSEERVAPALPLRIALGALIIKEKLGITDRERI
ncbi:hypothetical protein [Dapis sp. BLCC M229]|uniref:hypothetical protein n=1 Tax=Dapis sp. BLCC M229 TaxID=3400188 RepID=UPI003CEEE88F